MTLFTWTPEQLAALVKNIVIVRPREGKPSIHHMEAASKDVLKALSEAGGWKAIGKIANSLKKLGYLVEVRDFKPKEGA